MLRVKPIASDFAKLPQILRRNRSMTAASGATRATGRAFATACVAAASHHSRAATDQPTHRLAAIGMMCQRIILHALANFKALWLFGFTAGNGFVDVGGHGEWSYGAPATSRTKQKRRSREGTPL